MALRLLQPWAGICQHPRARSCVPAGGGHSSPGEMHVSCPTVPTGQWRGIGYDPSLLPPPLLLFFPVFFPPFARFIPLLFCVMPTIAGSWHLAPALAHISPPWSKGCTLPRTRAPPRAVPEAQTPPAWAAEPCCTLGWVAWGQGTWAPGMPHTRGKLLSCQQPLWVTVTPHRTVVHPSIHPSVPMLLSPIICFPCPSPCPKSITSVPLPRVLPPGPTAAPAAARCYPALQGVTALHQCLPLPTLADRLLEVTRGSAGAAAPWQLPLPQQVLGAGSPTCHPQAGTRRREEGTAGRGAGGRPSPAWGRVIPAQPALLL